MTGTEVVVIVIIMIITTVTAAMNTTDSPDKEVIASTRKGRPMLLKKLTLW